VGGFFKRIADWLKRPPVYWTIAIVLAAVVVMLVVYAIFGRWLEAILISVVLAVIGVLLLVLRSFLAMEREDRLGRGVEDLGAPEDEAGDEGEPVVLGFRRAIEEIRGSRLAAGGLDALPWLLVLGESGGGKTAAVRESGLDLPAEYASRVTGAPTGSVDWWLANEAIVIDLAGRYLLQEDDASEHEWRSLLRLLRRHRTGVAANGLIFAISVESLLSRSAGELEEHARALRRRLNEATDELGVDLPVYVMVTKLDQVEGFVEAIAASPVIRSDGALGWTNDQRVLADPEHAVVEGLSDLLGRLEGILPELMLREPDPVRRRRIFCLPDEMESVITALGRFLGRALAPTPYDAPPYLRGVYLTSARREGQTVSPMLHRLGHDRARHEVDGSLPAGGLLLRDLFLEIIVGDRDLALPVDRFGPRARAALHAVAGGLVGLLILWWALSFGSNWLGIRRVAAEAGAVAQGASSLAAMDGLREALEEEAADLRPIRRGGLGGPMEVALERGRTTFTWAFGREFADLAKRKLTSVVTGFDDGAFEALAQLATDVTFLAARGDSDTATAPDIARYAPINDNPTDVEAFDRGYAAFVRWSRTAEIQSAIDRESDVVARAASRLLELERLEAWARSSHAYRAVTYGSIGLPGSEGAETQVSGAFTRKAWEGLVVRLLEAIESTGKASDRARTFRDTYVARFDEQWRGLLLDTPIPVHSNPEVKSSPYLRYVEVLDHNTRADLPRRDPAPAWVGALRAARRTEAAPAPPSPDGTPAPPPPPPPWTAYQEALALVAADVEAAQEDGQTAVALATALAGRKGTSFEKAYKTASGMVPDAGDAPATERLEDVLHAPVLDAASAVLARAFQDLDRLWRAKVVEPTRGRLTTAKMQLLYGPGGAIDELRKGPLAPFLRNGEPVTALGNRAMPFGPAFLRWMKSAERLQRIFGGAGVGSDGKLAARVKGHPARVRTGTGMKVSGVELRLRCDDGTQTFDYRMGSRAHTFHWSPDCDELVVRVTVLEGSRQRELLPVKEWRGPMAFPLFLQSATRSGDLLQWRLRYADLGVEVEVIFELRDGEQLLALRHTDPPASMGR
jgi:hypothetical protein